MKIAIAVALVAVVWTGAAQAQTADELEAVVRSGICPANLSIYTDISYDKCDGIKSTSEHVFCQDRVNRANHKISEYNSFIYKCRDIQGRPQADGMQKGRSESTQAARRATEAEQQNQQNSWSSRLKGAQQRNQDMADTKRRNDQAYEKSVNDEVRKTQEIQQQNAIDYQRQVRQLRERQAQEARKIAPMEPVIGTNPYRSQWGDYYPKGCQKKASFDACWRNDCRREEWESPAVCVQCDWACWSK